MRDIQDGAREPKDRFGAGIHFEEDSFHPMYCALYHSHVYIDINVHTYSLTVHKVYKIKVYKTKCIKYRWIEKWTECLNSKL